MLERIGKYQIRSELGKGGFGQVYLGYDPPMDRLVAIKVMSAGGDSSLLIRFQTEATAAGNLNHKNIVTVYEFGEDRGMFFLAMEYLAGQDLQKAIDAHGSRSVLEKMRIMTQIAEGLLCAHQGGIVHRDVKPANIMLLADGTVKVLDFGIARMTKENSARLTQTGYLIGSVSHMAPEQFRGVEADVLCDIWAYGTIYYELLTGKNPFHAADAPSAMYRITNVDPEPVKTGCPDCPEALERVIAGLLAKDRANRYQSLEDVLFETAPILLELQKGEVTRLVSMAKHHIEEGKLDDAQQVVRRIIELDPMHAEGRSLRKQVRNELDLRSTRGRVEALKQKAEKAAVDRNYGEAIQALDRALEITPSDTLLRARLTELQKVQEQREKAQRLLTHAQSQLELQKFTQAFLSASEALKAEPDNAEARSLVARLEHMIADRDAERRLKEGLASAKRLLVVEALDEAIGVLEELAKHSPENTQVIDLLAKTVRQRDERDRRQRIAAGIDSARNAIKNGDFAKSISILEGLAKEFPGESSITEMLSYARDELQIREQAARIKAIGNEAYAASRAKDFEQALRLVGSGLATYPGNERLLQLQELILNERGEHDRNEAIRKALEESVRLERANRLEEALGVVDSALKNNPGDSGLQSAREELRRKIEEQERKRRADAIQEALTKARGMVEGGKADSATQLLTNATSIYPNAPELNSALDWARKEQVRQQEAQRVKEILAQAEALENEGKAGKALGAIEKGLAAYPHSSELTDAAVRLRTLVRLQQDLDSIAQPMGRKDWQTALTLIVGAKERHPGVESLMRLEEQARKEQQAAALESIRAQARRELDAQNPDRANETVANALRSFGRDPGLVALEFEIKKTLERRDNLESARQLCRQRDWMRAEVVLRRMLDRDPSDLEAESLLDRVLKERHDERLWQAREEAREDARRRLREQRFDEAEARLQGALKDFPGDAAILEDLGRVAEAKQQYLEARQQYLKEEAYRAGRQSAAASARALQFDAAISQLQTLLVQFPGDTTLEEDKRNYAAAKEQHERRIACERGRRNAAELLARREFDAAIQTLEPLAARFPGESEVQRDLEAAKSAKSLFEQRRQLDQQVEELEKLYRKGDPEGVKKHASGLNWGAHDPRIRELIAWADTEIATAAQDRARETVASLQARKRRQWVILAAIAGAAVVAALIIFYPKSPPKPPHLTLSSPEIDFRIEAGATSADSQTVLLRSGSDPQDWTAISSDPWLSASPKHGTTPAVITIAVHPPSLKPLLNLGAITFSNRDGSLRTSLQVKVMVDQRNGTQMAENHPPPPVTSAKSTHAEPKSAQKASPLPPIVATPPPPVAATPTAPAGPAPTVETPPAVEKPKIIDCHAPSYHGVIEGTLTWANGSLDPNGVLAFGKPGDAGAGGTVTGRPFPGCDVNVSVDTNDVEIIERPSVDNAFRTIRLRNKSGAPIAYVTVHWYRK